MNVATPAPALPARLGMMIAEPRRGLQLYEELGGGVRDAAWLVLAGILCFRLEDCTRAILGITHLSLGTVLRQALAIVSFEVREAIVVVLPAAVAITLLAGRDRRDPGRDLELGAACYVPYFAGRSIYRALSLEAVFGPLPPIYGQIAGGLSVFWACTVLGLAIAGARRRRVIPAGTPPGTPVPVPEPRIRTRVAVTALAGVLGAALFVNGGWVASHAGAIRPLAKGGAAPGFSLPRVDGQTGDLSLAELRGKVVLLDFWATWCAPCIHMMPTLHRLHGRWKGRGVEFVGINSDGATVSPGEVNAFLQQQPAPYPMVIDQWGEVGSLYKVVALPHMVLVDRQGTIVKSFWGMTGESEISRALAEATAE